MKLDLAEKLKAILDSMSQEDFDKEWAEIKSLGMEGPTVEELFRSWRFPQGRRGSYTLNSTSPQTEVSVNCDFTIAA